jgi:hypothetical protein
VFRGASNMTVEQKQDAKTPPTERKTEPPKAEKPPEAKSTEASSSSDTPKTM